MACHSSMCTLGPGWVLSDTAQVMSHPGHLDPAVLPWVDNLQQKHPASGEGWELLSHP